MRRKKPLKGMVKDIATFTGGSMIAGVGAVGISKMGIPGVAGTHIGAGMAQVGSGLRAVAPVMMLKHQVGLLQSSLPKELKMSKRRRW